MNIENNSVTELKKHWQSQIYALDKAAIVAITNRKGVITYVNPMFCALSEYSEEELIGKTHSLVNSGYHNADFFRNMWTTIGRGEAWRGEIKNRAKSGRYYWVDTTIVPLKNEDNEIEQFIAIRYDISSKKEVEASLLQNEKMASLGVLSAGIAHELGNPLGAIRGRLEMLQSLCEQESMQKEMVVRSIGKMIDSVDRMSKIIRALKSSARDGSRDEMQEFNLSQLVGDIVEISSPKCFKNSIAVKVLGLDQACFVKGRETELAQVVVNLFNNAFDSVKGRTEAWIEVELVKKDDQAEIRIKDSGPGVPQELLPKIFDPFFTTKDVGQGTGLGLSICRSFMEGHGGTVLYSPEEGVSQFIIRLPAN